ncbi:MAG: tripartite tricarboxylate transporter substrate binding protein [Mahellales bacterium]|jgi:tripartite-type tricarboxylate transporter receptor subunit TctC
MLRRILSLLLVLTLIFTFTTACSTKEDPQGVSSEKQEEVASETSTGDYPNKPITLVLGYSAGGSSDVMVRILANTLEKYIGQPIVVVNKPGAGGWVCWEEVIKSVKPDGYTFALINTPNLTLGAYDEANPRQYTIDDFDLLCNHVTDSSVIAIRNDESRFSDLPSLVEYAKKNTLLVAASAVGIMSDDATVAEYFNMYHGTDIQIVQTGGAKENETMFLAGDTDILIANIADVRTAHINGDYKVIAVFAPERSELLPDVPTAAEQGFSDFYMFSARGYALPKGVDPSIKEKLLDALRGAIHDPEVKNKLDEIGAQTDYKDGQEYYDFLKANIDMSKKIYGIE